MTETSQNCSSSANSRCNWLNRPRVIIGSGSVIPPRVTIADGSHIAFHAGIGYVPLGVFAQGGGPGRAALAKVAVQHVPRAAGGRIGVRPTGQAQVSPEQIVSLRPVALCGTRRG